MTTLAAAEEGLPPLDALDADDATQVDIRPPDFEPQDAPARPVEAPPLTVHAPLPTPSTAGPTAESRLPLDQIWPGPPRKREIPPKLKVGLGAAVLLFAIIVALGSRGTPVPPEAAVAIEDEMVISAEDLKNRREVHADDFRPKRQFLEVGPRAPAPPPPNGASDGTDMSARRARRDADPEDVLTLRKSRKADSSPRPQPVAMEEPLFDGPVYVGAGGETSSASGSARPLIAAGTTVRAVLLTPLELRGDSGTVVVKVDKQGALPAGARFIGTATASASRITMRFQSLLYPDGKQVRVEAEAQDEEGAFGLAGNEHEPVDDDGSPSATDVAKDTVSDVLVGALGTDIAGRAADRYLRSRKHRQTRELPSFSLAAGTHLQIFVHDISDR